jgi:hypothetical protein
MAKLHLDNKRRTELIEELFGIRDDLMWYEEAAGISECTEEKIAVDALICKLQKMKEEGNG